MTRRPIFRKPSGGGEGTIAATGHQGIDVVHSKQPQQLVAAIDFFAAAVFARHREREGIAAVARANDRPSLMRDPRTESGAIPNDH
jgi:hypothetical protein